MRTIRDCNVCIIGGAGFLGSHLVDHLIDDRSCNVLVLDNLISGHRKHIHKQARFIWHDIRDEVNRLTSILAMEDVDYVFNYAAEPFIPECFDRPKHFFDINATAVLNVLEASRTAGVTAILQVSSAEIYGDSTGKVNEDAPVIPHSTYGVSKVAADGLVQVRWREAGVPAIAMRQFNCIGPRETHDYVVPEIISQLAISNTVHLGNNSYRDFQSAKDAVRMAVLLLEKGEFGEVYNMGSETGMKIYDLANLIGKLMGYEEIAIDIDESRMRPWEIWHLQSCNDKLYSVIGKQTPQPLEEALQETIQYFHDNDNRWDF